MLLLLHYLLRGVGYLCGQFVMPSTAGSKKKKKGSRWGNAAGAAAAARPVAAAAAKPKPIAGGGRGNVIAMEEDQARKIRYS